MPLELHRYDVPDSRADRSARESAARLLVISCLSLFLAGCALPQWRVLQKKIDPELAQKPAAQVEAERQGAKFIVEASSVITENPSQQIADIHSVAIPLSASLGEPKKPVVIADQIAVIKALEAGLRAEQKKADAWKAFAVKHAGTPLEGTGINLAGPAGILGLIGIIAACIACPALGYALLRLLPLLWGYFRRTTQAINEFAASNPDAAEKLKEQLSRRMDEAHKALVRNHAVKA
jgi:hypothetical protein